jgi:hypothetical protein
MTTTMAVPLAGFFDFNFPLMPGMAIFSTGNDSRQNICHLMHFLRLNHKGIACRKSPGQRLQAVPRQGSQPASLPAFR